MQQQQIANYLERFFTANSCDILEKSLGHMKVQLTIEMDKELMNRPFYWHYLEKTGGVPNPMQLTFITNKSYVSSDLKGEHMHFGAPRLHQIFRSTQQLGSYIRLYENSRPQENTPLHPWLGVNVTVSYQCDMKKDMIYSIGLHLISGAIVENFQEQLEKMELTPKIPDMCFTISPIIKPQSGLTRIKQYIQSHIEQDDHEWAGDARQRMNADLMLLSHFYEDLEEKPEIYYLEKEALKDLYEPKVSVTIHNGGIFYLTKKSMF
ncbi:YqhG family protein [Metabacillus arenae]|uniref:YqhG family protein n=1 Tax=Metabacillus arenae TaxID=2771434 RepID=A0A926NIM9_9BACI|nr:YqhG family protein [Metabacillus arenae]MBD1378822.1 YqhG family protein [Metabacillus arenae]